MGIGVVGEGRGAESSAIGFGGVVVDDLSPALVEIPIAHDVGVPADNFFIHIKLYLGLGKGFFPDADFIDLSLEELISMAVGSEAEGFACQL